VPRGAGGELAKGLWSGVPVSMSLEAGALERLERLEGVAAAAPQYFLASASASCCDFGNLLLIGFDPARDFTVRPWAARPAARLPADPIWVGAAVSRAPGQTLRLHELPFRVAERFDATGLGYFDNSAFVPLPGLRVRAEKLLDRLGLASRRGWRPDALSGGERRRLGLARALVGRPELIILDEPTADLDREWAEKVMELVLGRARKLGAALVIASHDADVVARATHRHAMAAGVLAPA
jgi:ABC-type uncharacterized transport system ATPase subunit